MQVKVVLDGMVERRVEGETIVGLNFQMIKRARKGSLMVNKIREESVMKYEVCWTRQVSGL